MKRLLALLLTLALLFTLVACGNGGNEAEPTPEAELAAPVAPPFDESEDMDLLAIYAGINSEFSPTPVSADTFQVGAIDRPLRIAVSARTMGSGFFYAVHSGVIEELEAHGVEVLFADAGESVETQTNQLDNFVAQGVDGIIVNVATPAEALTPALQRAAEAGIPVVGVDSILDEDFHNFLGFIGGDNFLLGFGIGEYMATRLLERDGTVAGSLAILNGEPNPIADTRVAGFWAGIESVYAEHEVIEVAHLYGGAWTEEAGVQMAENVLVANPQLDLIMGVADPFVVGAMAAAGRMGRDEMIMGAVDGSSAALRLVQEGTPVEVITMQNPVGLGQISVRMLLDFLTNDTVPLYRLMRLYPLVATPENIDELFDPNSPF